MEKMKSIAKISVAKSLRPDQLLKVFSFPPQNSKAFIILYLGYLLYFFIRTDICLLDD